MKRRCKLIFTAVFLLICCIPVYTMPWLSDDGSAEKRVLAESPSLIVDGKINPDFPSQTDTYLSEHFSFRGRLVNALTEAEAAIFKTSAEEQVIIGKDGWLYFSKTAADYTGSSRLSDRQADELAAVLRLINEYAAGQRARFLFFVSPNKNTVYPQYMPGRYFQSSSPSNYETLNAALSGEEWYLDLSDAFADSEEQLYHKRDTHWNNRGAFLCYHLAMEQLGLEPVDFDANGSSLQKTWRGDLDTMLFPTSARTDWQVIYDYETGYRFTSNYRSDEDINISTYHSSRTGKLLMFRDSFTNALLPFFAESFETADFTRVFPYRLNALETGGYDTVIIEIAERNIPNLLDSAPVMPAPERNGENAEKAEPERYETETISGLFHVYGSVKSDAKRIFAECVTKTGTVAYEAFPVYESKLGARAEGETGFSVYLPPEAEEAYEINILVSKDGLK